MYDGLKHVCLEDTHIVNIFSFSKAYGMMGWRVGYVSDALPDRLLSSKVFRVTIVFFSPSLLFIFFGIV